MSYTPNTLVNEGRKSPSSTTGQTVASLQPPYGSRSGTISTLPPPQQTSLTNGTTSSQIYPPPLHYPSHSTGAQAISSAANNSFNKLGHAGADAFNYPPLTSPHGSLVAQKFPQLPQVSAQSLPQTGYALTASSFPKTNENSFTHAHSAAQSPYQGFAAQDHQFSSHSQASNGDGKTFALSGSAPYATSLEPAFSKQVRYPSPDSEVETRAEQETYSHTAKFIHSKHSKLQKDAKSMRSKFPSASTSEFKPFLCKFDGCNWSFARKSDLRRHAKSHIAPGFHCPYWKNDPTCHRNGGSFSRLDVLKRHLGLVHYIKDKDKTHGVVDQGWCRACQKLFCSSKSFISHCDDCASQVAPAEWKSNVSPTEEPEPTNE